MRAINQRTFSNCCSNSSFVLLSTRTTLTSTSMDLYQVVQFNKNKIKQMQLSKILIDRVSELPDEMILSY